MEQEYYLIYITNGYPFSERDSFSKDDISFLVQHHWKLLVVPRLEYLPQDTQSEKKQYTLDLSLCLPLWKRVLTLCSFAIFPLVWHEMKKNMQKGIKIRILPMLFALAEILYARNALRRLIKRHNLQDAPLCIYGFWFSPALLGASLLRKELPQLRIVSRFHGYDLYAERRKNNYMPFRFWRAEVIDIFAPCSQQGAEYLRQEGVAEEKIICAYLGVKPLSSIASATSKDILHLASCSFISPVKRIPLLAESLIAFAKSYPHIHIEWHHLGGGDGLEEIKIILEVTPKNLRSHLHGSVSKEASQAFFLGEQTQGLDGLISVSESEGLPVSMMEAQMVGLPVISTHVGGVAEIVTSETGKLIPENFMQEEFDEAVLSLVLWKDQQRREQIATYARQKFSLGNYKKFVDEVLWPELGHSKNILDKL